jgi:hypothetical protein
LTSKTSSEHEVTYTLASSSFATIREVEEKLRDDPAIITIQMAR